MKENYFSHRIKLGVRFVKRVSPLQQTVGLRTCLNALKRRLDVRCWQEGQAHQAPTIPVHGVTCHVG